MLAMIVQLLMDYLNIVGELLEVLLVSKCFLCSIQFYFFKINYRYIIDIHISRDESDTSLSRYFILLFINVYHTGLSGWLALIACIFAFLREQPGLRFVLIWCLGLIFIFTAFPISFSPLKFIAKQSNYLDIFALPLALLTGWFLAQQSRRIALLLGVTLGLLAGYYGGWVEELVMRLADVTLAFPTLLLLIAMVAAFEPGDEIRIVNDVIRHRGTGPEDFNRPAEFHAAVPGI